MSVDGVWLEMIRESAENELVENAAIIDGAIKLDFIVTAGMSADSKYSERKHTPSL